MLKYICAKFHTLGNSLALLWENQEIFFFGEYEAEDLWLGHQAHRREGYAKNWGIK